MNRKPIFDSLRRLLGRGLLQAEVAGLDAAIDAAIDSGPAEPDAPSPSPAPSPAPALGLGTAGLELITRWEGCGKRRSDGRFEAYPDPGSADGRPWTIGWGSTGPEVVRGLIWTQEQCDARLAQDLARHAGHVAEVLAEAPTSQDQFDALVSFHYNTGAIGKATLTRLHRQGRFDEAAQEFAKWIYNAGKPMAGLKRRRAEEAALYAGKLPGAT